MKKTMLVSILTAFAVSAFATTVDDAIVYRPTTGGWYGSYSLSGGGFNDDSNLGAAAPVDTSMTGFGLSSAKPLVGDVNGDGIDDMVVAQLNGSGLGYQWAAAHSVGTEPIMSKAATSVVGTFGTVSGNAGNFLGDITGDGIQDIITINNGFNWYTSASTVAGIGTGATQGPKQFGLVGDNPVVGDFNGDGMEDIGLYRNGTTYVNLTAGGLLGAGAVKVGAIGATAWNDYSLVGDINGDGFDDLVILDDDGTSGGPVNMLRWITAFGNANGALNYGTPGVDSSNQISFGLVGDIPMLADINGDGLDDLVVVRDDAGVPNQKRWFSAYTGAGGVLSNVVGSEANFGLNSDIGVFGQLNVVPEPASIGMILVGGGILWTRKRFMV